MSACGDEGEPPEPAGASARSFVSGSRLKAVVAEASDGTTVFLHWRDTQLAVPCRFAITNDGMRCLPAARDVPTIFEGVHASFKDATCSEPLLGGALKEGQPSLVQRLNPKDGKRTGYFLVRDRFAGPAAYRQTNDGCIAQDVASGDFFFELEPFAPGGFARATRVASPLENGVSSLHVVGEDGSREPVGFRDAAGVDCWPRQTVQGLRCVPLDFAQSGDVFADALCKQKAAVGDHAWPETRGHVPFVIEGSFGSNGISAIYKGGPRLAEAFSAVGEGGCQHNQGQADVFAIGEPVPLTNFAPATFSQLERRTGLSQTVAQVHGVTIGAFALPFTKTLGGFECTLAVAPDKVVRCVPPVEVSTLEYAEASCTEGIWGVDRPLVSISARAYEQSPLGVATLPVVERILKGGIRHLGAVYARQNGACVLREDVPNSRQHYYRFAGEVNPSSLVAMPIKEL